MKALNDQEKDLLEQALGNNGVTTYYVATNPFKAGIRLVRKKLMTMSRTLVLLLESDVLLSRSPWHYDFRLTSKGREIARGFTQVPEQEGWGCTTGDA